KVNDLRQILLSPFGDSFSVFNGSVHGSMHLGTSGRMLPLPCTKDAKATQAETLFTEALFPYGPRLPKPQKGGLGRLKGQRLPFLPFFPFAGKLSSKCYKSVNNNPPHPCQLTKL
ncbi:MAG: hypothetical protein II272_10010, partial [Oscillospiraceae bacterium]|nr:hypothetical protein [Oscillospiraceae bacterium]